jgi:hypothetical protein
MEEIIQHNANELSHIITQYQLDRKYVLLITEFLNRENEDRSIYYKKLDILKNKLKKHPFSYIFLRYLNYGYVPGPYVWKRGDPIEKTPKEHTIIARYSRVKPRLRDMYAGKPVPDIFIDNHRGYIQRGDVLYSIIKNFGYDFKDEIYVDGMIFKLYDMYNPTYIADGVTPFFVNGKETFPMSNLLYTKLYKAYLESKS